MRILSLIIFLVLTAAPLAKAELTWYTTRAAAVEKAAKDGKMVLLVFGRNTCSNTKKTRSNMEKTEIQRMLNSSFVLWWCDADDSSVRTESYVYWPDLDRITLPMVCVIDPASPTSYKERTTGVLSTSDLKSLLTPYLKQETEPAETMTVNKSDNEPLYAWLAANSNIWYANNVDISCDDDKAIIENPGNLDGISTLDISGSQQINIDSILFRMPNLKTLNCEDNMLDSIDIRRNTALEELYCSNNRLATLDISNCTNLADPSKFVICPQESGMDGIIATDSQKIALASQLSCVGQPKFEIAIDGNIANGSITASQAEAAEGAVIKLSITPLSGYELKENSLKIYKTGEEDSVFHVNADSTFIMPACPVTITALFEAVVANEYAIGGGIEAWSNGGTICIRTENPGNIHIYDFTGRLVRSCKASSGTTSVSGFPKGLYVLRLHDKAFKIFVE